MRIITFLLVIFSTLTFSQNTDINPQLLEKTWQAQWIYHPTVSPTDYGVFHFRKSFDLENVPENFIIHVSADNRYRLFVNGSPVCFGPARGDILNWRYESIDISPHLVKGKNVLSAVVWNFGGYKPAAQLTLRTAFILQGNSGTEALVNSNNSWKVIHNKAWAPIPVNYTMVRGYYVAGPGDRVNGVAYPWGWERTDFNDNGWAHAAAINNPGVPRGVYNYAGNSGWNLVPRNIPMMEETRQRIPVVVRSTGIHLKDSLVTPVTIPPNSDCTLLLDNTCLTIGYPEFRIDGGQGGQMTVTYAEALFDKDGKKGNRNETSGKKILGYRDEFLPDGGKDRLFRPLWYRTFRFLQLDIQTSSDPLTIRDLSYVFTAYPFKENAVFDSGDKMLDAIWKAGWRTARLCATETFADCPYYEQLQYLGDTRIQALISLYVSGDDRLMRNALRQFDNSRIPSGITMSRYPTLFPQFHPTFSLIFILMVHDYFYHRDDFEFTEKFLFGISTVLHWFHERTSNTGLLGRLPWPNYMDAAPNFGPAGAPPGTRTGQSAQITLLYAYALDNAAELFDFYQKSDRAKEYSNRAKHLKSAVYQSCYDMEKKLFAETPKKKHWTQHTNILAILSDAIPENQQKSLMQQILTDSTLIPAQIYFRFYLMRALKKTGMGDLYLENLRPWETMIGMGLTTFAERALEGRSDCHAWSASPCYDFLATVAGITPGEPGFLSVIIQPKLGRLNKLCTAMPHPKGEILLTLKKTGQSGLNGQVILPPGLDGIFIWNGKSTVLNSGETKLMYK